MFSLKWLDHNVITSTEKTASWEPGRSSCSQEISGVLWKPNFHYNIEKRFSLPHILGQTNPVLVLPLCLFNIHFNIILFVPKFFKCFVSFRLPITTLHAFFFSTTCATCSSHLILLDLIILTSGEEYKSWSFHLCTFLQSSVTFFLLGPNVFFTILFPVTLGLIYVTFL